jgi:two-component system, LytTR family, sensor kinase
MVAGFQPNDGLLKFSGALLNGGSRLQALVLLLSGMKKENQNRRRAGMHLLVWGLLFVVGVTVFGAYYPLHLVLMHASGNIALLMLLFYGSVLIVNRFAERGAWLLSVLLAGILFAAVSIPRILVNLYLARQFPQEVQMQAPLNLFWRVTAMALATSALIQVLGVSFALLQNRYRRERQTQALLAEQQAAQVDFLKAQINPHFLFNALNNLYSLVALKSDDAPQMLLKLSELLRYAVYDGREKQVRLAGEVQQIRNFIDLYQMRSETPANIVFEVKGEPAAQQLEPMILIPLVENCFKHCDFDLNPNAYARIELHVVGDQLHFSTTNTFQTHDRQKDEVGGVGLANIARRLALRYPNAYTFEYGAQGSIFHTSLQLN